LNRRVTLADQILETYLRVVDGSESASYDWTLSASNDFVDAMFLIQDAVQSVIPHKENGQTNVGSTTTITAPSLTTTLDNCLLVGCFAGDPPTSALTTFSSVMTTKIVDIGPGWANLAVGTEVFSTAGVTGTRTATASRTQAHNGSMGQLLAFAPAPVSGGPQLFGRQIYLMP
jgi:hypothetical protein